MSTLAPALCLRPPACPLQVHNEGGSRRVVVTKNLPGERWLQILTAAGCRVEVCTHPDIILDNATIKALLGDKCDGVIGQLTEVCVVQAGVGGVASSLGSWQSPRQLAAWSDARTVLCARPILLLLRATQDWGAELFEALRGAGGRAYSNYAVGYNNVKVPEASQRGIPVGNTPGAGGPGGGSVSWSTAVAVNQQAGDGTSQSR
jgi:hydroxypyruvate reductase 1